MNVERLRELLEAAVKLELATIPPYLCALYSIHPGTNVEATLVVRSVVVEEMLHMVLAANVLNAIGGRPRVSGREHAPHYPHELPDGVILDLLPFSPAAVESFLQVENPEYKAEAQAADAAHGRRDTVHASHVLTRRRRARPRSARSTPRSWRASRRSRPRSARRRCSAATRPARSAATTTTPPAARRSSSPTSTRPAGRSRRSSSRARATWPTPSTPTATSPTTTASSSSSTAAATSPATAWASPPARRWRSTSTRSIRCCPTRGWTSSPTRTCAPPCERANREWSLLLIQIDEAFNGTPAALIPAVHTMFRLRDAMLVLLANPMPGHEGYHAGPTFEWVDLVPDTDAAAAIPSTVKAGS